MEERTAESTAEHNQDAHGIEEYNQDGHGEKDCRPPKPEQGLPVGEWMFAFDKTNPKLPRQTLTNPEDETQELYAYAYRLLRKDASGENVSGYRVAWRYGHTWLTPTMTLKQIEQSFVDRREKEKKRAADEPERLQCADQEAGVSAAEEPAGEGRSGSVDLRSGSVDLRSIGGCNAQSETQVCAEPVSAEPAAQGGASAAEYTLFSYP